MIKHLVLASVLAFAGCKKKEEPAPAPTTTETGSGSAAAAGSGSAAAGSAAGAAAAAGSGDAAGSAAGSAATAEDTADSVTIVVGHSKPKPDDPVLVKFEKFAVTKAAFDPANLEGATAQFTIDLTSVNSGSAKRDGHLQSPDYFDTAKFATATVDVANVKKKDGNFYTADAKVNFRGTDKTYPVTFEVVETKADAVRIRGEHEFSRLDFGVGKPTTDANEGAGEQLKIKLQLTLKKA